MKPRRAALPVAIALSGLLAACGGGGDSTAPPTAAPGPTITSTADTMTADLVGAGCASYVAAEPKDGALEEMANSPLVTAASKDPQLKTFVSAVTGKLNKRVDLESTLDGRAYTVFAPTDAAFARLPAATMNKLATDPALLVRTLTYHVVAAKLSSTQIVGRQRTVQGGDVTIARSANSVTVNGAKVICGGLRTANANLYLIDTVLTAPAPETAPALKK